VSFNGQPAQVSPFAVKALYMRHDAYAAAHAMATATMTVCMVSDVFMRG
jgi:hypothetical protein